MHVAHDPIFIALSLLTAWFGSWTALDLFRRVRAHVGKWRLAWLAAAGIAMGLSIWAMHFIAMLGFTPGATVRYDIALTLLSLLLAIVATTVAFFAARGHELRPLLVSGVVMGAGICTMHYVGMAAVIASVQLANEPIYVLLAFLVAVSASTGALAVARRDTTLVQRILAAVVLGAAISGMHYTAMMGVRVSPGRAQAAASGGVDPFVLAVAVAAGTLFILLLALIAAMSDRRLKDISMHEAVRSEQQLRAILDNLPIGIFVAASPSGEIRFANAEAQRLLERPLQAEVFWAQQASGAVVNELGEPVGPEGYALYKAIHEQRRVGPQIQLYRRANGELARFEVTVAPIADRTQEGALAVAAFQDVTAKLIAEEQAREAITLRESEERFRLIAEHAPVMLWMSDARGHSVYLNKLMRDFHGVTADWTGSLTGQDRARFLAQLEAPLSAVDGFAMEAQLESPDGPRLIQIRACPRVDAQGEFLGLIGVNADITATRQAQRDLERINDLLAQRVTAALAEKADAEAALMHSQRLEALGRLTGGVAHDFNNLLTVVIGALDVILRDPDNAARRTRLGQAALTAARRGERLTAQLLAFARRQPLQPEACDLNELIRECEPLLRRGIGDSLVFTVRLGADKAVALVDPAQFEALLLNLIVNAVDASGTAGEITLETQVRDIAAGELTNVTPGHYVCVIVTDLGIGMSAEVLDHIFEPFFTTKPPSKGSGLGLSQVYGFVKQSGGDVQVSSQPGKGTRVSVYLPLSLADTKPKHAGKISVERVTRSLRVLLADDDPQVAGIAEAMLLDLGHQVTRSASAEQALQVIRSDAPLDLLLSDVVMPGGMNGVELAHEAARLRPQLPILLSSGYAGEALDESIARGAWPFLKKPYLASELAEALQKLVPEGDQASESKLA